VIVNGVDTGRVGRAALALRASPGSGAVAVPADRVAAWLAALSLYAEHAQPGEYIPGLQLAGWVAGSVLGEEESGD
jgi:hypothetical protein